MNAIERLSKMSQIAHAIDAEDFGLLALAVGMNDEMFDELPIDELLQIIRVRLNTIFDGISNEQK